MKANYKKLEDIVAYIWRTELGEFFKFDNLGRYEFFKYEKYASPVLSHLIVKFRGQKGKHYDDQTVRILRNGWKDVWSSDKLYKEET